jgi:hypothetical protein
MGAISVSARIDVGDGANDFLQLAFKYRLRPQPRKLYLYDRRGIHATPSLMKSRSDPSAQRFSLLDCFSALRAVADVVRQGLAFVRAKSIKKVIVQSLFC